MPRVLGAWDAKALTLSILGVSSVLLDHARLLKLPARLLRTARCGVLVLALLQVSAHRHVLASAAAEIPE